MKARCKIIKVAYAEDHVVMRDAMVGYLEKDRSIKVVIMSDNGQQLIERLILADQLPDICLLDVSMPVMNGFTTLIEIRKRWPSLPCLILTAFIEEAYIINMIKNGPNGYLVKTCTGPELIKAVKSVYKNGYYYNDILNQKIIDNIIQIKQKDPVLNNREKELLNLVCSDLSYADIAQQWGTTYKTIDGVRERLMAKLRINSRVGLVLAAIRLGYYTIESQKFANTNNEKTKK